MKIPPAILHELHPSRFFYSLIAGLMGGMLAVIIMTSYATLIFSGPLRSHLLIGIGIALISLVLVTVVLSLTSSYPGTIGSLTTPPTIILSLLITSMSSDLQQGASGPDPLTTIYVALGLSALLTGAFFLFLGAFRLGRLIRFIPYPVIGGILAGVAILLLRGAFNASIGFDIGLENLERALETSAVVKWLPALAFAILLIVVQRRFTHIFIFPALIIGAFGLFYLVTFRFGLTLDTLRAGGWLLGDITEGWIWPPPGYGAPMDVQWGIIASHLPLLSTLVVVNGIALLLDGSVLELNARQDIDLDKELKTTGVANILSGLLGGMPGSVNLVISNTALRMGAPNRLTGLVCAGVCVAVIYYGGSVLAFIPRPIAGGLLMFFGLSLLITWIYEAWYRLPRADYFVVLLITINVFAIGYLEGVAVGVVAGVILFIVNYSRINVIKNTFSGAKFHSNVDRPEPAKVHLQQKGDRIYILKLQGYIFFGTANRLLDQVRSRIEAPKAEPLRFILLDFRLVIGLDSSSTISFIKMRQYAERFGFQIILTGLPPDLQAQLEKGGLVTTADDRVRFFPDLYRGLQWGEDRLLRSSRGSLLEYEDISMEEYFQRFLAKASDVKKMMAYLEKLDFEPGEVLIQQGEPSEDLYFIGSGRLLVELNLSEGQTVVVRTLGPGTFVGEVAFYHRLPRSASVVAENKATVYRLSSGSLTSMEKENPEIAAPLHQFMARLLARRIFDTDQLLQEALE